MHPEKDTSRKYC